MTRGPAKSFDEAQTLDKAMIEFWQRGYAATTVSDLREATGLGAKSLYDTYGGKRDLYLACLARYGEKVLPENFDEVIARQPPKAALKAILRNLVRDSRLGRAKGCFLGVAAADLEDDPELTAAIRARLEQVQQTLERVLQQIPRKPGAPKAGDLASLLMTLLQGIHLIARVEGTEAHSRASLRMALRMVDEYCAE